MGIQLVASGADEVDLQPTLVQREAQVVRLLRRERSSVVARCGEAGFVAMLRRAEEHHGVRAGQNDVLPPMARAQCEKDDRRTRLDSRLLAAVEADPDWPRAMMAMRLDRYRRVPEHRVKRHRVPRAIREVLSVANTDDEGRRD